MPKDKSPEVHIPEPMWQLAVRRTRSQAVLWHTIEQIAVHSYIQGLIDGADTEAHRREKVRMTITINGTEHEWTKGTISHEEICELAGQPVHASTTYSVKLGDDHSRSGTTCKGKTIPVDNGMIIDCIVTGSAL